MDGMDKNKTFLIVGLGLLGGKYAQVLSQKGYRVTGITHSQSTLDYALEHAYICEGRNENFDDLVQNADYIIFGLYPTVLLEWVKQYGHLVPRHADNRCFRRKARRGGAGAADAAGGRGVHCQPPHGRP